MRESMKKVKKGVFLVRKGLCTIANKVKFRKIREKRGKIRKIWSITKKGHQKFLPPKWKFFRKNLILVREKFFRPLKLGARFPPLVMMIKILMLTLMVSKMRATSTTMTMTTIVMMNNIIHDDDDDYFNDDDE